MKNAAEFENTRDDVFERIASRYDLLCDLFSLGIHRIWKRRVSDLVSEEPWDNLLDVASGTGDIVLKLLQKKKLLSNQKVIVSDICRKMLSIAERKIDDYRENIRFERINAHSINEIDSSSIDVYSISLGLKICDREKAMQEAFRVLKPGGRFVSLEASNIPFNWLHNLYLFYMALCMPFIGWVATGGDSSAYKYLLHGVRDFPSAEDLKTEIESIGFEKVKYERLSLGIVAIHIAVKPECA
ncbi:ubiquinone/menaquinone biosynthesis methyltransferase [Exilibacterium tricleocarpae]|uniref:ubiquinone/menaquinone biosynthesis methyltransferase n=1 Tax=Exilibacterium tricleocarpae TaxID=2591008 RepID=UPI0015D1BFA8|nr:ubiquinone/menaquinone biosynthesis methyltransferase [Exilibacterium tricleocarpae]